MFRKILVIVSVVTIGFCCLIGCKKRSSETKAEAVKSSAEYEAEAKKEINKENAASELDKIENEVEQEGGKG